MKDRQWDSMLRQSSLASKADASHSTWVLQPFKRVFRVGHECLQVPAKRVFRLPGESDFEQQELHLVTVPENKWDSMSCRASARRDSSPS